MSVHLHLTVLDGESTDALTASIAAIGWRFVPPVNTTTASEMVSKPWCERPRCRERGVAPRLNRWGRSHHGLRVADR